MVACASSTEAARSESLRLGNHRPENAGEHILLEEFGIMAHSHKLDGVGVQRSLVGRALADEVIVYGQMGGKLRGGLHGIVGNDFIVGAVVGDADYRAVLHRVAGEVAHTAVCAFAEEIFTFEVGQGHTDGHCGRDCGHSPHIVVDVVGDVDGDVAAVAFGPSLLPEIACYFGHIGYLFGQCGAVV